MNDEAKIKKIYLDTNATTPLADEVYDKICEVLKNHWANPSSCHAKGVDAKNVIVKARRQVATMVNAKPEDVVFTSGGTESNNLAIFSAFQQFINNNKSKINLKAIKKKEKAILENKDVYKGNETKRIKLSESNNLGEGERITTEPDRLYTNNDGTITSDHMENGLDKTIKAHIITTSLEHDSVKLYLKHFRDSHQAELSTVDALGGGVVSVEKVIGAIKDNTCLISVMLANNETGVLQPVQRIAERLEEVNKERQTSKLPQVLLHCDAAQVVGKMKVDVVALKTNYLTVVGHKFYGPRVGALVVRGTVVHNMLHGGGQEGGLRPGTENTGMIAGLGMACELVSLNLKEYSRKMKCLRDEFERKMQAAFPDQMVVHCAGEMRIPNTCNFSFKHPLLMGRRVVEELKLVEAGVGAACHSHHTCKPSPILLTSGVSTELALNAIRVSFGRETCLDDINIVIEDFRQAVCNIARL